MSPAAFHVSLNVHDLAVTTSFLERLFDKPPARRHSDYAKFELADPPVVLSLIPSDVPRAASLNHLGFRLPSAGALADLKRRLTEAEIPFESEESVACCHSQQSKLWVHDPAGNLWELYVLKDAVDCSASEPAISVLSVASPTAAGKLAAKPAVTLPAKPAATSPVVAQRPTSAWSHRLGEPFPDRIAFDDSSIDEVVLEGTLNASPDGIDLPQALREVARVLRPGGRLLIHGLTADRPLRERPRLPGPAAMVEHVPTLGDVLAAVTAAGFANLELTTYGETYCFQHAGAELRETRIVASRSAAPVDSRRVVIYRGPFAELRDDAGNVYRRGERTEVDGASHTALAASSAATQFVFL